MFQEFKMDILSTLRYRFSILSDIIVYTVLLSFFFMSGTGSSFAETYGTDNYRALLLLGYISWSLSVACISMVGNEIRNETQRGTLYQKLASKTPLQVLYLSKLFSGVIVQLGIILCYVLVAVFLFDVQFYINFTMIIAILTCVIGMYGIGLVIGGLSLFFKRIGNIILLVQLTLLFITDTVPSNDAILSVSRFIPLTICNEIIRSSYAGLPVGQLFIQLIISSIVFFAVGCFIFQFTLSRSRKTGNLLLY